MQIRWNQNGNWLLTASRDHLLKLFDIRAMKEMQTFRGHKREATGKSNPPFNKVKIGVNGLFKLNVKYLWPPLLTMSLSCSFNFLLVHLKLSHSRPPYGKFSDNIFWMCFLVIFLWSPKFLSLSSGE